MNGLRKVGDCQLLRAGEVAKVQESILKHVLRSYLVIPGRGSVTCSAGLSCFTVLQTRCPELAWI